MSEMRELSANQGMYITHAGVIVGTSILVGPLTGMYRVWVYIEHYGLVDIFINERVLESLGCDLAELKNKRCTVRLMPNHAVLVKVFRA